MAAPFSKLSQIVSTLVWPHISSHRLNSSPATLLSGAPRPGAPTENHGKERRQGLTFYGVQGGPSAGVYTELADANKASQGIKGVQMKKFKKKEAAEFWVASVKASDGAPNPQQSWPASRPTKAVKQATSVGDLGAQASGTAAPGAASVVGSGVASKGPSEGFPAGADGLSGGAPAAAPGADGPPRGAVAEPPAPGGAASGGQGATQSASSAAALPSGGLPAAADGLSGGSPATPAAGGPRVATGAGEVIS